MKKNLFLLLVSFGVVFTTAILQIMGVIDIRGILNQGSSAVNNPVNNRANINLNTKNTSPGKCATTYPYCGKGSINPKEPVGPNNPITEGVQIIASCDCPSNTYLVKNFGNAGKYCECR